MRPGALMYRAQVSLGGAHDNQLDTLGGVPLYATSRDVDETLTGGVRRMPFVNESSVEAAQPRPRA